MKDFERGWGEGHRTQISTAHRVTVAACATPAKKRHARIGRDAEGLSRSKRRTKTLCIRTRNTQLQEFGDGDQSITLRCETSDELW